MHSVGIHRVIGLIISIFYLIGVWHRGDQPTVKEMRIKSFYCIYYAFFFLSFVVGAMKADKVDDSIFLAEVSIGTAVLAMKFWILIWKQNEILNLLNRVCEFSIRIEDDFNRFNNNLRGFMKFVFAFVIAITGAGSLSTVVFPLLGRDRTLFVDIGFPLDYKRSEIAFWIAATFLFTEMFLSIIIMIFTVVIWYLLLTCSLRYKVLESELRNMGRISGKASRKIREKQMHNNYTEDLKTSIDVHLQLRDLIKEVEAFFSNLFFTQLATKGMCICGSIYCLAFDIGDNLVERLIYLFVFVYFIAELFMITYFGNEIMLSSNRLSYSLFESDWYNQPQSTKKCIIIFGEYLKQPQELVIGKLYPLTLETFTRIMNSAYSMFNILKSFQ